MDIYIYIYFWNVFSKYATYLDDLNICISVGLKLHFWTSRVSYRQVSHACILNLRVDMVNNGMKWHGAVNHLTKHQPRNIIRYSIYTYIYIFFKKSVTFLNDSCHIPGRLTHRSLSKMAAMSQTTLSSVFSRMEMLEFLFKLHWSKGTIYNKPTLV